MEDIKISSETKKVLCVLQKIKDLNKEIEKVVRDYYAEKHGAIDGKCYAELLLNRDAGNGNRAKGDADGLSYHFRCIEDEFIKQELVYGMTESLLEQTVIKTL